MKPLGCFLVGVTGKDYTENGEALIGSVSDDPYDIRTFLKYVPDKKDFSHIGTELISTTEHTLTERGYFANPDETTRGINKAGLAFTCAMVMEKEEVINKEGTPYHQLTTAIMKKCSSVQEAIDLFASAGPIYPAYSLLLADAMGGLAHIELGSFGVAINHLYSSKKPGAVFAVNCYLSEQFQKYNAPNTEITTLTNNNSYRRERGISFINQSLGEINVSTLSKLLSDHQNNEKDPLNNPILPAWGFSICNHGTRKTDSYPREDLPWGTVSAEIMQPSKQLFWYAYGWPCGESPKYGDQLFQQNSWGKFLPFGFTLKNVEQTTRLTTPEGTLLTSSSP